MAKTIKAKYILEAEDKTKLALKKADNNLKGFGKRVGKINGLLAAVGAGLSFNAIVDATKRQEQAMAQLEARIKSTAGVAGKSADDLSKFAGELQKVTTYGDEAVMEMQSLLLTFTNIRGGVFDDATRTVLDISVAMGTDLKSSALQLGKALNDPIKGLDGLSRAGIQFSDAQKKVIKDMVATGDVVGAQRAVLAELETQFGGAAEAAADTFGGAMAQLSNAFGDLLESKGGLNEAKDSLQDLTELLQDPQFVANVNILTSAMISGFAAVAESIAETARFMKWLGEETSAALNGIRPEDTIRLQQEADRLREVMNSFNFARRIKFFGADGLFEYHDQGELQAELSRIENQIKQNRAQMQDTTVIPVVPASDNPTNKPYSVGAADGKPTKAALAALKQQQKTQKLYVSTLQSMQRQLVAIDQQTQYEKTLWETQNGRYASLNENQKQALLSSASAIDQRKQEIAEDQAAATLEAELNSQAQSWRDLLDPMSDVDQQLEELGALFDAGKISLVTYAQGLEHVKKGFEGVNDETVETADKMSEFAVQGARNIQTAFSDFLFAPFSGEMDSMAANFAKTMKRMAAEALSQQILKSLFSGLAGMGGAGGSFFSALVAHDGAIAGVSGGTRRNVSPLLFAGAPRYHSGGIAGLKPNEVPAILERGEQVIPNAQQQAGGQSMRMVIVDDRDSVGDYMASSGGEQVMLETIRRNAQTIKRFFNGV